MIKVPFAKIDRNEKTAVFFLILYVLFNAILGLYVVPMCAPIHYEAAGTLAFLSMAILAVFIIASIRDPGYLKRDSTIDFQNLLDHTDPYNL